MFHSCPIDPNDHYRGVEKKTNGGSIYNTNTFEIYIYCNVCNTKCTRHILAISRNR